MILPLKLEESSLTRIWTQNEQFDCGALTAFRKAENCGEGKEFTKKENEARNKSLLAKLKSKNYSVISLLGTYPEGGKTTKEKSFFVVDVNNTGNLEKDLKKLKGKNEDYHEDIEKAKQKIMEAEKNIEMNVVEQENKTKEIDTQKAVVTFSGWDGKSYNGEGSTLNVWVNKFYPGMEFVKRGRGKYNAFHEIKRNEKHPITGFDTVDYHTDINEITGKI